MSNTTDTNFEDSYIKLRQRENRVYSDADVFKLPLIDKSDPHFKEWAIRKSSARKLYKWLAHKKKPLNILEIGCGNGWLCNHLSGIENSFITGLDINLTELQQAGRVFKNTHNLQFIYGSLNNKEFNAQKFDAIIFAASIQYFQVLDDILHTALQSLSTNGEIHIIDSPFYNEQNVAAARKATLDYYNRIGFPEMVNFYFHHTLHEIRSYNYSVMYKPSRLKNNFFRHTSPFPWICIKAKN